jgi:hypothetical protein
MIEITQYLFYKFSRLLQFYKYRNEYDKKISLMEEGKLSNILYIPIHNKKI